MAAVDIHQHLWPPSMIEALARRRTPPRLRGTVLELPGEAESEVDLRAHDLSTRVAYMDRDGIEVAVVSCPPTLALPEDLLDAYHEGILGLVADADGRLLALAADAVLEGFVGTCVAAHALLDLDGLATIADGLDRSNRFLFVHPGPGRRPAQAPSWWPPVVDYTAQMQAAYFAWITGGAQRWPELRLVFAVLAGGGPFQLERLASRGVDVRNALLANVYLDVASYGRRALELCLSTFGVGQLVYGSDLPVVDPALTLQAVRGFGEATAEMLLEVNPARVLA